MLAKWSDDETLQLFSSLIVRIEPRGKEFKDGRRIGWKLPNTIAEATLLGHSYWIRRDKGRSCTETNTAGMEAANNSSIRSRCNIKPCHHPWPCVWDRPIPAMFKTKVKSNHTVDQNYTSKTHCTFQRGLASI